MKIEKTLNKKKINIVAHTHWDREWYFSQDDSKLLSVYNFEYVLDTLENNKDFTSFCLDGQTSIIEDYLEFKPENKQRIINLVKNNKLEIGPWYTQTDSFYVQGESYLRNLYFGIKFSNELGGVMNIGYLPDTFGHNIQTPEIMKGFGLNSILFWRGYDKNKFKHPYFNWKSLSGEEILAVNLTYGYGAAKWLSNSQKEWDEKTIPMIGNIAKQVGEYKNILLPSGGDQVLINNNLPKTIEELNKYSKKYEFKLSSYQGFINELKKEIKHNDNLEKFQGEFRDPMTARVHQTIGSSRYDIKRLSSILEHKIINILEPLSIFIFEKVDKSLINFPAIEKAWKLLLDGHAHDSLGACNTDITNDNIMNRFKKSENIIDGLINIFKKTIGKNIFNQHGNELVLYNFETKNRNISKEISIFTKWENFEIIDTNNKEIDYELIEIIKHSGGRKILVTPEGEKEVEIDPYNEFKIIINLKLESFGYNSYEIVETDKQAIIPNLTTENTISNDYFEISISNEKINLINKKYNNKIEDFIKIEDVANDGDSYDFSPIKKDTPITKMNIISSKARTISEQIKELLVEFTMELPYELLNRTSRSKAKKTQNFIISIQLNNDKINFKLTTINVVKDHRIRLIIDSGTNKQELITGTQFGYINRRKEKFPLNWKEIMVEKPLNYYPIVNSLYFESDYLFNLTSMSLKEIEILGNGKIGLTLYKSDGFLGKNNLEFRPNRASGINNIAVLTPDAQLINNELEFEFQIRVQELTDNNQLQAEENKNLYISKFDYYQYQSLNVSTNRLERFEIPIKKYLIEPRASILGETDLNLVASYLSFYDKKIIMRFLNLKNNSIKTSEYEKQLNGKHVNFNEKKLKERVVNKYGLFTIKI